MNRASNRSTARNSSIPRGGRSTSRKRRGRQPVAVAAQPSEMAAQGGNAFSSQTIGNGKAAFFQRMMAFFGTWTGNALIEALFWYLTLNVYVYFAKDMKSYDMIAVVIVIQFILQAIAVFMRSSEIQILRSAGALMINFLMIIKQILLFINGDPDINVLSTAVAFGTLVTYNSYRLKCAVALAKA